MGRPSKYKPEYCEALVIHMRAGNSIESFGSNLHCSVQTIYNWLDKYPAFLEAKRVGTSHLHKFLEDMGKMLATGQLRRLKAEEPVLFTGKDGRQYATTDAQGNVVYRKVYETVPGNSTAWIFYCKNQLGWRDKRDVEHSGTIENPSKPQVVIIELPKNGREAK